MNKVILRQEDGLYVKQILSTDINIAIFTFLHQKTQSKHSSLPINEDIRSLVIENMISPFIDTHMSSQISCYRISWQIYTVYTCMTASSNIIFQNKCFGEFHHHIFRGRIYKASTLVKDFSQ